MKDEIYKTEPARCMENAGKIRAAMICGGKSAALGGRVGSEAQNSKGSEAIGSEKSLP